MQKFLMTATVMTALVALVGCNNAGDSSQSTGGGGANTTTSAPQASLAGTSWSLNGSETAFITFDDGTVSGNSSCNVLTGGYTIGDGASVIFGELASSRRLCDNATMDAEQAFLDAMGTVASYIVRGDALTLQNTAGATVLSFTRRKEG